MGNFNIKFDKISFDDIKIYKKISENKINVNNSNNYNEIEYSQEIINETNFFNKDSCYNKIYYNNNDIFYMDPKVSISGKIEDYTDYQNCLTGELNCNELNKIFNGKNLDEYSGKTLYQLYESGIYENTKLVNYINYGFGDLRLIEVLNGEKGFNAIVFQDIEGNYLLSFPCTSVGQKEDIVYDAEHVLSVDFAEIFSTFNLSGLQIGSYHSQKKQARKLAEKYFNKAKQDGVKLNISGFSLGGSLAEDVYLELSKQDIFGFNYEDNNNMGDLILYEPVHNNLSNREVKFLKEMNEKGKINIYCVEGSMVSTYYNHDDLKDIEHFIYADYLTQVKKQLKYDSTFIEEFMNKKISYEYFSFDVNIALKSIFTDNELKHLAFLINNCKIIFGCAHSASNPLEFRDISFDENGNVKRIVQKKDKDGNFYDYQVQSPSFEEISKSIYGTDLKKEMKLLNDFSSFVIDLNDIVKGEKNVFSIKTDSLNAVGVLGNILSSGALDLHERNILFKLKDQYGDYGIGVFNVGNAIEVGLDIYDGCRKIENGLKWSGGKIEKGFKWTGGKIVEGLKWSGGKIEKGFKWTSGKVAEGLKWTGGKIEKGFKWGKEIVGDFVEWIF